MSYDAGTAFLQIIPSFRGFGAAARRAGAAAGRDAGETFSEEFNRVTAARTGRASVGPDRSSSARAGGASAGAFAEAFRARLEAARRSFGDIQVGVATSQAEQTLRDLQARIAALAGKEIDIDIGAAEAMNEVRLLEAQLQLLASNSPDITVRVNSARAVAELKLLQTQINRIDGQNPTVTPIVNPGPAAAGIGLIGIAALTLLPILIPITAAATAALAGIATGAFVATAGLGVLVLALYKVFAAVQAGKAADEASGKASATVAAQRTAAANAADQLASAERALTNAKATAARQEQAAARTLTEALRRVTDVRRENARAAEAAATSVGDAEDRLTEAQQRALDAQQALTQARRDAQDALEDLDSRVKNNALAQRDAALALEKAESDLAFVRQFGERANSRQLEQAQLAYDEARQRAEDLARAEGRLVEERDAATKAGVEGSDQVAAAKRAIEDANAAAAKAEADLAAARQAAVQTQEDNARRLADAQRSVADAHERVADQAQQSAFALANAEQSVVSAQRAVEAASTRMDAGTDAVNKYRDALDKLSPAGQRFVAFIRKSLMPGFTQLRKTAETGFLPGLEAGLKAAAPAFEPLRRLVGATAKGLGVLAEKAGKALGGPFWTKFFDDMAKVMGPNMEIFGRILGGLAKTFAGLLMAFQPLAKSFGEGFARMTERWAKFAEQAASGKSKGFNRFMDYLRDVIPKVKAFLGSFFDALGHVIKALAPLGEDLMAIFKVVFDTISKFPLSLIGSIAAGLLGMAVAMKIVNAVMRANPIALVIGLIAGLAVGLVYAYRHSEKFRSIVDGTFRVIGTVISFFWNNVAKPVFTALVAYYRDVLFPVVRFLWSNVVKPVFKAIGATIEFAWTKVIRPVFSALGNFIADKVAPAFAAGVEAIGKIWDGLKSIAAAPVNFIIDTVINNGIIDAIRTVQGWFGLSKLEHVPNPLKGSAKDPGVSAHRGSLGWGGSFNTGGVMPGYTPGVDNALIAVGGGEAIMRPEWTRAVGADYVDAANAAARSGGVRGVGRFLGIPGFALGGIFNGIKNGIGKAIDFGTSTARFIASPIKWLRDKLGAGLKRLSELGSGPFLDMVKAGPGFLVGKIVDAAKAIFGIGGGDEVDTARGAAGLQFAAGQRGKPYVFGGVGPGGFDCSGFISAIANVIAGEPNPFRRLFTTASFAGGRGAGGFVPGPGGRFVLGVVQGDPGHMAGTLGGVNVESRAGDGVVIGPSARGAFDALFTDRFHLAGYDSGGYLPPGVTMAVNRTGRPEPILTAGQWDDIAASLSGRSGGAVGGGALVSIDEFHAHENQTPHQIAADLLWMSKERG